MRRLSILVLLAALAPLHAAEGGIISFHLKSDPLVTLRGYLEEWTPEGFTYHALGPTHRTRRVAWKDLVEEDATRLRIEVGLERTQEQKLGLIPGHRLHFRGGAHQDGLLLEIDAQGRHLLKVQGMVLPYPKDRIDEVEDIAVKETEVYSREEIYVRALEQGAPRSAAEHLVLADHLFDRGALLEAKDHYEQALALDPRLKDELRNRLAEIGELAANEEVRALIAETRYLSSIRHKDGEALGKLREFASAHPEYERLVERELGRVRTRAYRRKRTEFIYRKHDRLHREVERYLRRKPALAEARKWAVTELPEILKERLKRDMQLEDEEFKDLLEYRGHGALHWAGYWTGSFILSKRASIGKKTKSRVAGDPEGWWAKYSQISTQRNWLKAYVAERLPEFFDVVSVQFRPSKRSGGDGIRDVGSLTSVGGKHSWKETCPQCFGAARERIVGFR